MSIIISIFTTLFFGGLTYFLATKRGRNRKFWLLMGLLFGPLALVILLLPKIEQIDKPAS